MNNEMMRLFLYLLSLEDMKKQGDRIIRETKNNSSVEGLADVLFARIKEVDAKAFEEVQLFMSEQRQASIHISGEIAEIRKKIEIIDKLEVVDKLVIRVDELEKNVQIPKRKNS